VPGGKLSVSFGIPKNTMGPKLSVIKDIGRTDLWTRKYVGDAAKGVFSRRRKKCTREKLAGTLTHAIYVGEKSANL
jgi:hypothetical protein